MQLVEGAMTVLGSFSLEILERDSSELGKEMALCGSAGTQSIITWELGGPRLPVTPATFEEGEQVVAR